MKILVSYMIIANKESADLYGHNFCSCSGNSTVLTEEVLKELIPKLRRHAIESYRTVLPLDYQPLWGDLVITSVTRLDD